MFTLPMFFNNTLPIVQLSRLSMTDYQHQPMSLNECFFQLVILLLTGVLMLVLMWSTYAIFWLHIYGEEYVEAKMQRTHEQLMRFHLEHTNPESMEEWLRRFHDENTTRETE